MKKGDWAFLWIQSLFYLIDVTVKSFTYFDYKYRYVTFSYQEKEVILSLP